jgi:hypothetical protein
MKLCRLLYSSPFLGDHTGDLSGPNVRDKLFPTGPFKVSPAPSVIRVMKYVGKTSLGGIAFKHGLLRCIV